MNGFVTLLNVHSVEFENVGHEVKLYYPTKVKLVNNKLFMVVDSHFVRVDLLTVLNLKFSFKEKV